jgi:hypothetical protein
MLVLNINSNRKSVSHGFLAGIFNEGRDAVKALNLIHQSCLQSRECSRSLSLWRELIGFGRWDVGVDINCLLCILRVLGTGAWDALVGGLKHRIFPSFFLITYRVFSWNRELPLELMITFSLMK